MDKYVVIEKKSRDLAVALAVVGWILCIVLGYMAFVTHIENEHNKMLVDFCEHPRVLGQG